MVSPGRLEKGWTEKLCVVNKSAAEAAEGVLCQFEYEGFLDWFWFRLLEFCSVSEVIQIVSDKEAVYYFGHLKHLSVWWLKPDTFAC